MAYDGIAAAAAVKELNDRLLMGSITKVAQPEKDELLLTLKCNRQQLRLLISANASTPMVCLKEENELSPVTAPNFCMALRKHIGGGRVVRIFQPSSAFAADAAECQGDGLERIIVFEIEHLDEMGDLSTKYLIAEIMGKHSNIILTKNDLTIIDSIKHVSHMTSSVREVLPGRKYFIPDAASKADPIALYKDEQAFNELMKKEPVLPLYKKIYMSITGLSPAMSAELLSRAGVDGDITGNAVSEAELAGLYREFAALMTDVDEGRFEPCVIYDKDRISEFSGVRLRSLEGGDFKAEYFDSMSEVIRLFYEKKDKQNRIRAKSEDIRHILKTLTERAAKKLELLEKQYADTDKRDKYRVWGELLNTYGYSLKGGEESFECENYYDEGRLIRIPLDKQLTGAENAKKYFDKYQKLKRTREAVALQLEECRNTLYQLDSIGNSLSLCENEADLNELRREMAESGLTGRGSAGSFSGNAGAGRTGQGGKNGRSGGSGSSPVSKKGGKGREEKSKPLHFVSSDGIDIYVGRNNYQNEELDFKVADNSDWWFHAKNIAGSHVIAKTGPKELPDRTCLEAAALAAYYSKAGAAGTSKVEVDYVKKKELRRVPGAAPGFVIYHTNYSIMIEPKADI